jgi:hypothetical protein
MIADAVWDEDVTGHNNTSTMGALIFGTPTAVWAYTAGAGRTLTSLTALASQIASAVWGALKSAFVDPLTMGGALNAAGSAVDPLNNAVPGAYAQGTAGAVLGSINPANVTVQSPVSVLGDTLELVRGDDYFLADGRSLPFSSDDWPNLTGATNITMTARRRVEAFGTGSDTVLFATTDLGTSRVVGTGTQTVVFQPTAAMTALLLPGVETGKFDIQATLATSGHIITLVVGKITVIEDQTRAS